ncbi:MAG: PfkB family carbohydrate kinase [Patescibacteria group bacterium]|nr:PfkB family carbohydrate kinase [Patescibacteria group bacterium]
MNVLVVGSLAYDSVMYCPGRLSDSISEETIQGISLNISAHKLERYYGGTAGSIAYTLKLLGIQPFIVAGVGNDCSDYKQFLKKNKIPTTYIQEHRTERTSAYVCVRDKYQNSIGIFYEGAGKEMSFSIFESIREHIHFAIIAPTYPHIMTQAIKVYKTGNSIPV